MYIDLAPEFTDAGTPVIKFTSDDDANELLANDPNALLIAIVLDQQITTTKAFSGPRDLKQRWDTSIRRRSPRWTRTSS